VAEVTMQSLPATPTSLHGVPAPESFSDVEAYLKQLLENFEHDTHAEVIPAIGLSAYNRSLGRVTILRDLLAWLKPAVECEARDRARAAATDSIEDAYRSAGYGSMSPLIQRRMDGDR
jgi:hypothetical protein